MLCLDELVPYSKFSHSTKINWQGIDSLPKNLTCIYKSKSGSKYWSDGIYIYRKSKHWGGIGTCKWKIKHPVIKNKKKYGPCGLGQNKKSGRPVLLFFKPILGKCKISDIKYIAPKPPKRYIKDDKGFLIINPEFKIYLNTYNIVCN